MEDSWKCCPEGWRRFQESCYYFSADQMPWDESQQNCSGMGSHLVVINTEAEQVSAGLREGQSSLETGVPGLEGPQPLLAPAVEGGCPCCIHSALAPVCHQLPPTGTPATSLCSVLNLMDVVLSLISRISSISK